jgi:anti-anti-sigma factor
VTDDGLRIELVERGGAAVARLAGRFDGAGAARFDREALGTLAAHGAVVLDLSAVPYVSSAAVRSFLRLAQALDAAGGAFVVSGLTPFVSQVLELSGLLGSLRTVEDVTGALALLESGRPATGPMELVREGRRWRVTPLAPSSGRFVHWGVADGAPCGSGDPASWESPSVAQLGLAVGRGGFGTNRAGACREAGPFVSTGRLVALAPSGQRGEPDFLLTDRPSESTVHVGCGVAFEGAPLLHLRLEEGSVPLGSLADDARELACCTDAGTAGFVIVAARGGDGAGTDVVAAGLAGPLAAALATGEGSEATPGGASHFAVGVGRTGPRPALAPGAKLETVLGELLGLEALEAVSVLGTAERLERVEAWVFSPGPEVRGRERLTEVVVEGGAPIPDEWLTIVRRICSDAGRVTLRTLAGGYSATTYQVESVDREGRRTIPTVLKIADLSFTSREEKAWRESVQPFILNNATVIMGRAAEGAWAGLRYNFLGITGASSRLRWLGDRYSERPFPELVPILDTLFGEILDPWYGQAREEDAPLWSMHDPSALFPRIALDAREVLGIDPSAPDVDVPELGTRLPNPYRTLAGWRAAGMVRTRRCKVSITHGDLNPNNVLLDEKDNIYVIDFSETRRRSAVADFARLEALLALQTTRIEDVSDFVRVARFFEGLVSVGSLAEAPPLVDDGGDPAVPKAWEFITLLRRHAARVASPGTDLVPFLLPLLEWTIPIVSWVQLSPLAKRLSMVASALVVRRLEALDPEG